MRSVIYSSRQHTEVACKTACILARPLASQKSIQKTSGVAPMPDPAVHENQGVAHAPRCPEPGCAAFPYPGVVLSRPARCGVASCGVS